MNGVSDDHEGSCDRDSAIRAGKRRKIFHNDDGTTPDTDQPIFEPTLPPRRRISRDEYTVGWVSALPLEMAAARGMLDEIHEESGRAQGDTNVYTLGSMAGHNCVLACLPMGIYGTTSATEVACGMRSSFPKITTWLVVGVGGGAPTDEVDIRLGDVVVGTRGVIQYDYGKTITNGRFEQTGSLIRPPSLLLKAISKLQSEHQVNGLGNISKLVRDMLDRYPDKKQNYLSPGPEHDILFESEYEHVSGGDACMKCDRTRIKPRTPRTTLDPVVHYGTVASGNRVIKHAQTRDKHAREIGILCFEMEAAGLIDFPFLTIRGICDYSDSHKNKEWQEYAAATAAAYTKELLFHTPREDQGSFQNHVTMETIKKQREDLIKSLGFVQMQSREFTIRPAHKQTCEWLLQDERYQNWLDPTKINDHHGFLWMKGKPGTGKSTIIKFACENLRQRHRAGGVVILPFFFNARGEELERSVVGMYRSLLWQLFNATPTAQTALDHLVRANDGTQTITWDLENLRALFFTAVKTLHRHRIICLIDALDECNEDDVRDMVDLFVNLTDLAVSIDLSLHVFFSSRHYPNISFNKGLQLILEHQAGHEQDIVYYLDSKLSAARELHSVKQEIVAKASGIFLWVVLVVEILKKEYDRGRMTAVHKRLREIPPRISDLFKDILTRDDDNIEDLLACLQWILFAKRLLTPRELYIAVLSRNTEDLEDLENVPDKDVVKRFILSSSKGLAEIVESSLAETVQFIHESVRDYFLKDGGIQDLLASVKGTNMFAGHELLKHCCQNYMNSCFSVDHLSILSPNLGRAYTKKKCATFPFIDYAAEFVLGHANEAEAEGVSQSTFFNKFPRKDWILINNNFNHLRRHANFSLYTCDANLLYIFAKENLVNLIKIPLSQGLSVLSPGEQFGSPLGAALLADNVPVLRELLTANGSDCALSQAIAQLLTVGTCIPWAEESAIESLLPGHNQGKSLIDFILKFNTYRLLNLLLDGGVVAGNETTIDGKTILHLALERGADDKIIKVLLNHGADPNMRTPSGKMPLTLVVEKNISNSSVGLPERLIRRGAQANFSPGHREILVFIAVNGNDLKLMNLLFAYGARPNHDPELWNKQLLYAVRHNSVELALLWIQHGADINYRQDGLAPLDIAALSGNVDMAKILLAHGANVKDKQDIFRPFKIAAISRNVNMAKILLEHGADFRALPRPHIQQLVNAMRRRFKPEKLLSVITNGYIPALKSVTDAQLVALLSATGDPRFLDVRGFKLALREGLDLYSQNDLGQPPLIAISLKEDNKTEIIQILLSERVDVDAIDNAGKTALHWTAQRGDCNIVRLLLQYGASTEIPDNFGNTPLLSACTLSPDDDPTPENRRVEVIDLLLKHGANVAVKNRCGQSALGKLPPFAEQSAALLRQHGAIL